MNTNTKTLPFMNPATGEQFGSVPMATEADVLAARGELAAAAPIWAGKPLRERVRILRKLQAVLIDSADEITAVINQDNGKSRQDALNEVIVAIDKLHQYYKHAPRWLRRKRVSPGLYPFRSYSVERIPFGVVGVIGPWNYPFDLIVPPICSALLAGNVVLVKPSEVTAATGALLEKIFKSIPELSPFVRFLHGDGLIGAALVASRPEMLFLTGSVETGKKIAQETAKTLTPFLYELGGKDPMIVLEDADVQAAARWGVWGAFYNTGQTCISVERVYVVEEVYDAFVAAVLVETQKYKLGYTTEIDSEFHLGPLTFERQVAIIEDHLQDALVKGAKILHGGKRDGMYMEPTVLVDVDHSMTLMRDETFGPIMPIMKIKDEAQAIQLANHSYLGLGACVWTNDRSRARRIAGQLETGSVNVNDVISHYPVSLLPFGGVKQSGSARTHGEAEVVQFTQSRSLAMGRPPLPFDLATIMRSPGHYRLGKAILRLAFGVTLQQRLEPIQELLEENPVVARTGRFVAAAGVTAAFVTTLVGLIRGRRD